MIECKNNTHFILSYLQNVDNFNFIIGNTRLFNLVLDPSEDNHKGFIWSINQDDARLNRFLHDSRVPTTMCV